MRQRKERKQSSGKNYNQLPRWVLYWIKILVLLAQVNRDSSPHNSIQSIKNKPQSNSVGTYLAVEALYLTKHIKRKKKVPTALRHGSLPAEYNMTTKRSTETSYRWASKGLTVRSAWTHLSSLPSWFVKLNWLLNNL